MRANTLYRDVGRGGMGGGGLNDISRSNIAEKAEIYIYTSLFQIICVSISACIVFSPEYQVESPHSGVVGGQRPPMPTDGSYVVSM